MGISAWGITVDTCYRFCSTGNIPYAKNFNWQTFAASLTNYFLPWLALTAQLPFETGDPWSNLVSQRSLASYALAPDTDSGRLQMSFCLAVGSPALVTFSLTITILNRFWVRKTFEELRKKAQGGIIGTRLTEYGNRIRAIQFLLQEAQQVPLRASQELGWLSSLIVTPGNTAWWNRLEGRLKGTRRGFTASLVAQMAVAAIAYLFTVISSVCQASIHEMRFQPADCILVPRQPG